MKDKALEFAASHRDENLDKLIEFLSIPSVSTEPERRGDVMRAADWLVEHMRRIGLDNAEAIPTEGHPIVYGEWLKAGKDAPTVLVYGHYDVQPTDPDDEWRSPPFEPVVKDGDLLARGASDDKGQLFTHLAAAEAFLSTTGQLPANLKFIIEGEEEVGMDHLDDFVCQNTDKLACDVVLISDTGMLNAETPAIVYGVRGITYIEFEVWGPKSDLHSGLYGGVVHNPLQVTVEILAALHDDEGRVIIPGFYDRVRPLTDEERAELARVPFDEDAFLRDEVGAPALWDGERGYTVLERIGARPTLEIHGIRGGYVGEGGKTVIPASALAKVSMRLVPDQDPQEIMQLIEDHIRKLAPPTVEVEVRSLGTGDSAVVDRDTPQMEAAIEAYQLGFGAAPVFLRSGGTIPVVSLMQRELDAPVIMMGFGLPDDNLHAPNEKFNLDCLYRGIDTVIHFMHELSVRS